jgi:cytochrome c biogenesis protein CcdA
MIGPMIGSAAGGAVFLFVIIGLGFYFLPSIVGAVRKVPNIGSVVVINLFLGWTLVGWVVALAMAARSVPSRQ